MRSLARLRPSPAMVVALLALFVALGGVSYAVATIDSSDIVNGSIRGRDVKNKSLTGDDVKDRSIKGGKIASNTVDSRNLQTGSVRSADVNNGAIGSVDVNNDSLTGVDINESTLGTVPFATAAGSATSAQNAATASTVKTIPLTTINEAGGSTPLLTVGPFTILAECISNAGTNTSLFIRIDTSEDNSDVGVYTDTQSDANFDAADGAKAIAEANDVPGGFPTGTHPDGFGDNLPEGAFDAFAPSGTAITGHVAGRADADAGASGQCTVHGGMIQSS